MASTRNFDRTLREAIRDIAQHGYDDPQRIMKWQRELRTALEREMVPQDVMRRRMEAAMRTIYRRLVNNGGALRANPTVGKFTIDRLQPQLQAELQKHIFASADLIRLNKEQVVEQTLRRFSGWATSVPAGGSGVTDKTEEYEHVRKGIAGLKFIERRVLIDQGHKLGTAINEVVAVGGGAIAAIWHSHYHQTNYDYRVDHKDREIESKKLPYVVRGNWAMEKGLMKLGGSTYTDDIERPGEYPFCRCYYQYLYTIHELPDSMVTDKGRESMKKKAA